LFNLLFIFFFQTIKIKGTIIKNWKKNLPLFIYSGKEEKIAGVKIKEKKKKEEREEELAIIKHTEALFTPRAILKCLLTKMILITSELPSKLKESQTCLSNAVPFHIC
jgi:hypothetical protein